MNSVQNINEKFIHVSRRMDIPTWKKWLIKVIGIVVGLLACALACSIINPGTFFAFFGKLVSGCFSTTRKIINLFEEMAILLLISFALTPAFKMKFWNIGAEGQVLMGALACTFVMKFIAPSVDNAFALIIELAMSIAFGIIWAAIPAIFKALFGTNETLFTLMMNYIAKGIILLMISIWVKTGSGVLEAISSGRLPNIGGYKYIINIIVVAIVAVVLSIYLSKSKHGYEISVIGGSVNTARYVGIDVKKVTIRTLILSGALCGLAGFLITAGGNYSINTDSAGGRGFTAILICWLANFNPLEMTLSSFLVAFISNGSKEAETAFNSGGSFVNILVGAFFFAIIAISFFSNYSIKFNFNVFKKKSNKEVA